MPIGAGTFFKLREQKQGRLRMQPETKFLRHDSLATKKGEPPEKRMPIRALSSWGENRREGQWRRPVSVEAFQKGRERRKGKRRRLPAQILHQWPCNVLLVARIEGCVRRFCIDGYVLKTLLSNFHRSVIVTASGRLAVLSLAQLNPSLS